MADGAAGFVVSDQVDALRRGVSGEPVGIEIGGRCREVEIVAVAQPVAVPARIPALDQPAADVVGGGEVDVFLHMLGGGAVRSEEHTSELQSLMRIPFAVF